MLCPGGTGANTPSLIAAPPTEGQSEDLLGKLGATPLHVGTNKDKEEELQLKRKIERLKQDLERYATSFEAGFLQRRSEEEAKDMYEKVSTLQEYEKSKEGAQELSDEAIKDTHQEGLTNPGLSATMEEEPWEVQRIVNDKILLISSAANIRRKEMQSRSKESAKNPEPSGGTVSIEEAKKLIKESMEKDDRGIKKRNPKSS